MTNKDAKELQVERQVALDRAEALVLDRLCGALASMQVLLNHKVRALRMEAGLPPEEPSKPSDGQTERYMAIVLTQLTQRNLSENYPEPWDESALGNATKIFPKEQLLFDLRQRVRSALARAFK